ncbi:MAG: hypothetical protein ACKVTZ_18260 [Bacteroidia bacterium]
MNTIIFEKSHHVLLDNGIIALYRYLNREDNEVLAKFSYQHKLTDTTLTIECEQLAALLEEVYYLMGREVYDTYTHKQDEDRGNIFFKKDETGAYQAELFPKMNTYGMTELLTNNAQGTMRREEDSMKIDEIEKQNPELAAFIRKTFEEKKLKLLSKVYFNERYTKITRLDAFHVDYFKEGKHHCYLTGKSYKRLVDVTSTSPFISGLTNFNSFLQNDKKISWQAMYLSRFAAAQALYAYTNKVYEAISVFLFESNTLTNLDNLYKTYVEGGKLKVNSIEWKNNNFVSNLRISNFAKEKGEYFVWKNEYAFMLIYTFYEQILVTAKEKATEIENPYEVLDDTISQTQPILVGIRAEPYGNTKRPTAFDYITKLRFLVRLFQYWVNHGVDMLAVLRSLRFIKPSLTGNQNKFALERVVRDRVLGLIIEGKSILSEMETLFFDCYRNLTAGENVGYKHYQQLELFITLYEPLISQTMDKSLQERAIKLGKSIGQSILNYEGQDRKLNAKQGRKYIIGLRKARTLEQFADELTRMQFRFAMSVSTEILEKLDESNFLLVKQFAVIAALNQLNSTLSFNQNNNDAK